MRAVCDVMPVNAGRKEANLWNAGWGPSANAERAGCMSEMVREGVASMRALHSPSQGRMGWLEVGPSGPRADGPTQPQMGSRVRGLQRTIACWRMQCSRHLISPLTNTFRPDVMHLARARLCGRKRSSPNCEDGRGWAVSIGRAHACGTGRTGGSCGSSFAETGWEWWESLSKSFH